VAHPSSGFPHGVSQRSTATLQPAVLCYQWGDCALGHLILFSKLIETEGHQVSQSFQTTGTSTLFNNAADLAPPQLPKTAQYTE